MKICRYCHKKEIKQPHKRHCGDLWCAIMYTECKKEFEEYLACAAEDFKNLREAKQ